MLKAIVGVFAAIAVLAGIAIYGAGMGWRGEHEGPGEITGPERPPAAVRAAAKAQSEAARTMGAPTAKQVLFGDLHVHTTASFDAFMMSMPLQQGEGSHPQADACDFARYCSALDFWSINDHAEGLTNRNWRDSIDSIRQCNAVAGDPADPDTVAYLGWEWTNVGDRPENHWGHKNVVLRDLDEDRIPTRPIAASNVVRITAQATPGFPARALLSLASDDRRYDDLVYYFAQRANLGLCEEDVPVRELPLDCIEGAETPRDLFRKLDDWGHEAIVIPHGTTWGMYTPEGSSWDKQLTAEQHDPQRQTLLEIYSGHGNSDVYRDWRAVDVAADGSVTCPQPRPEYLPRCWRAGQIVRERCLADGESESECAEREVEARQLAAEARLQGHLTIDGYDPLEWLDAGQCRDCDEPSFNYRPAGSAQYMMALSNFDGDAGEPQRFRFGFMSSSDNHFARPGTGYKEVNRSGNSESRTQRPGAAGPLTAVLARPETERASRAKPFDRDNTELFGFQLFEMERQSSFFMTGGLIAAHSAARDRGSIWDSFQRREVYGTSGPRMLLWFDLLNPPGSRGQSLPMGGEVEMRRNPIFQVRAIGSFEQKPGCPDYVTSALAPERVSRLCKDECYNPAEARRPITRIEVVRIQPQASAGEPVAPLIQDPWRSFACDGDPAGCAVVFEDPEFDAASRDALYYVRAFEAPAPAINAGGVRCREDAAGNCVEIDLCGDDGDFGDDCLSEHEPKAWSSPIFVDWPAAEAG